MKRRVILIIFITIFLSLVSTQAFAIPTLQLYIEGSTYDPATESWTIVTIDPFILWIIGDVGSYGSIFDVQLVAAFPSSESGTIAITSTTTALLVDPSNPLTPTFSGAGTDTAPITGDGDPLPSHGIYGPCTSWNTYALGDFTLTDSPIGDFTNTFPIDFPKTGQINAYIIDIDGYSTVHFDAFDHIVAGKHVKYIKAPFSHNADAVVPEPGTLMLVGSGLIGVGVYRWRRMRRK